MSSDTWDPILLVVVLLVALALFVIVLSGV